MTKDIGKSIFKCNILLVAQVYNYINDWGGEHSLFIAYPEDITISSPMFYTSRFTTQTSNKWRHWQVVTCLSITESLWAVDQNTKFD